MNLKKKIRELFTSKFLGTGPSSYEKRIYRATVSQSLRNTAILYNCTSLVCYYFVLPGYNSDAEPTDRQDTGRVT